LRQSSIGLDHHRCSGKSSHFPHKFHHLPYPLAAVGTDDIRAGILESLDGGAKIVAHIAKKAAGSPTKSHGCQDRKLQRYRSGGFDRHNRLLDVAHGLYRHEIDSRLDQNPNLSTKALEQ